MKAVARTAPTGDLLEADICIVGAGPAGLVIASELAGSGLQVIVLESGRRGDDPRAQLLNRAEVIGEYGDVSAMRRRQLGGTPNLWNSEIKGVRAAKYVPLDRLDFLERSWRPGAFWPFARDLLEPYYARAQQIAGITTPLTEDGAWEAARREPFIPTSDVLTSGVYMFGVATPFLATLPHQIASAPNVRLITRATVVELETDAAGERVQFARAVVDGRTQSRIRAQRFVLAAGAIENARLLLASNGAAHAQGLGAGSGWLGRGFMEHPRDFALTFTPSRREFFEEAGFYDLHKGPGGVWIMGRIALKEEALTDNELPNASVTLLASAPSNGALLSPLKRLIMQGRRSYPRGGAGWSHDPAWRSACRQFRMLVNLEQAAHRENCIALANERDALGMRKAQVRWRWTSAEQAGLERLRALLIREFEAARVGKVHCEHGALPDPNAHHHAGTTRMHQDPLAGVVDRSCRVHDVENLYCAGASVFPTAGFANPMLTILALSCRLADHLRETSGATAHSREEAAPVA